MITYQQFKKHKCKHCKFRDLDAIYDVCDIHTDIKGNPRCANYCKISWFGKCIMKIKQLLGK